MWASPQWREENKANQMFPRAELAKDGKEIAIGQGQVSQAAWPAGMSRDKHARGAAHPSLLPRSLLAVLPTVPLPHPLPFVTEHPRTHHYIGKHPPFPHVQALLHRLSPTGPSQAGATRGDMGWRAAPLAPLQCRTQ